MRYSSVLGVANTRTAFVSQIVGMRGIRHFSQTVSVRTDHANFAATTRKVICIGRNYVDHIKELGNTAGKEPFFFLKPPSSILEPGGGPLQLPRGVKSHFEIELGLVMGKMLKDLDKSDTQKAYDSVAGYFLAIDMTARNIQEQNKKKGLPWTTAKGFDTYLPVSKFIPKMQIEDPHNIVLKLEVNGVEKQSDNTILMIYKIPVNDIQLLPKRDANSVQGHSVARVLHHDLVSWRCNNTPVY